MNQQSNSRRSASAPGGGRATRPNPQPDPATPTPHPAPSSPPSPSGAPPKPVNTYRARSLTSLQPTVRGDATERATALVRGKTRRRRLRTTLLVFGALLAACAAAAWVWASNTVGVMVQTFTEISSTPVPVRPGPDNGTPVPVTFPDWGKEPVNILLIGLDLRDEDEETRADTQIIVHVDPLAKTATMLSIPRDLWVTIPGYGEGRINTAYQLGEQNKDEILGGGPSLAMATIEQNFGIPIHYFAWVDFQGFERIIDAMGGVTIDVPRPLVDNEYPLNSYGVTRIYIPAGLQHMDGRTALQYARSRHADSDLGRNFRQQQLLLALRQQGLNLNLITKLNELALRLRDAVKTDLSITQVGSLAQLAQDIGPESIQTVLLEPPCVNQTVLPSGADVLIPDWSCIRPKIAQAMTDPRLAKEAARLSLQNGTNTGGMATRVRDLLLPKGFIVADLTAAPDQGNHPVTTITDFTNGQKPRTIEALAKALGIDPSEVRQGDPADAPLATTDGRPVDILVIVGDDRIPTGE